MSFPADDGEHLIKMRGVADADAQAERDWCACVGKRGSPEHDEAAEWHSMAVWMYVRGYLAGSEASYATGVEIGRETGWEDCLAAYNYPDIA
jgi:hypothetical protein